MTSSHHPINPAPPEGVRSTTVVVRVELTPVAKQQSAAAADRFGMTQVATLSRLVEWFTGRSSTIQAAVLGRDASPGSDVSRTVLKEIADRPSSRTA